MEIDKGSDQKSDVLPQCIAAHARLKIEFTEGNKCHNRKSAQLQSVLYQAVLHVRRFASARKTP